MVTMEILSILKTLVLKEKQISQHIIIIRQYILQADTKCSLRS